MTTDIFEISSSNLRELLKQLGIKTKYPAKALADLNLEFQDGEFIIRQSDINRVREKYERKLWIATPSHFPGEYIFKRISHEQAKLLLKTGAFTQIYDEDQILKLQLEQEVNQLKIGSVKTELETIKHQHQVALSCRPTIVLQSNTHYKLHENLKLNHAVSQPIILISGRNIKVDFGGYEVCDTSQNPLKHPLICIAENSSNIEICNGIFTGFMNHVIKAEGVNNLYVHDLAFKEMNHCHHAAGSQVALSLNRCISLELENLMFDGMYAYNETCDPYMSAIDILNSENILLGAMEFLNFHHKGSKGKLIGLHMKDCKQIKQEGTLKCRNFSGTVDVIGSVLKSCINVALDQCVFTDLSSSEGMISAVQLDTCNNLKLRRLKISKVEYIGQEHQTHEKLDGALALDILQCSRLKFGRITVKHCHSTGDIVYGMALRHMTSNVQMKDVQIHDLENRNLSIFTSQASGIHIDPSSHKLDIEACHIYEIKNEGVKSNATNIYGNDHQGLHVHECK